MVEQGEDPRALVTGGTGFIGSHVVDELLSAGYTVRALVRDRTRLRWLGGKPVELTDGDLSTDLPDAALNGVDSIFHFAGLTRGTRDDLWSVNHGGTRRLVEAASRLGTRPSFVYCSSQAAAGPTVPGRPLSETDPPRPTSEYGRSKLAGEEAVSAGDVDGVILRPVAVYGPRDRDTLPYFQMAARGFVLIPGVRERFVQLVHARDVACAARLAAERAEHPRGPTYFIGHPDTTSWSELSSAIADAVGRDAIALRVPSPILRLAGALAELLGVADGPGRLDRRRAGDLLERAWVCRVDHAMRSLDWEPAYDLETGLRETANWYRDREWL